MNTGKLPGRRVGSATKLALGVAGVALGLAACGTAPPHQAHAAAPLTVSANSPSAQPSQGTPSAGTTAGPAPSAAAGTSAAAKQDAKPGTSQTTNPTTKPGTEGKPATSDAAPGSALSTAVTGTVRTSLAAYTAESWTAQAAGPVRRIAGHDITLNECATVHGAATWQQQPYLSSGGNPALLEMYTFTTQAAADTAYQQIDTGMAGCQATSKALQTRNHLTADALSQQTAGTAQAAAFDRSWTGVEGISAAGKQTNHLYLAEHGTSVLVLHFDELAGGSTAAPYDVHQDAGVLSLLTNLPAGQTGSH